MKRITEAVIVRVGVMAGLMLAATALPSGAQTFLPRPQGDAAGFVGWLGARDGHRTPQGGDRTVHALFGAASTGWYWTDHLKTEVDIGAGTEADGYRGHPVVIDGVQMFQTIETASRRRTLGLSHHYQFFRNAWFHPHVGAGVNLTWERRIDRYGPVVVYDGSPFGRVVRDAHTVGPHTTFTARPFIATGFKAYIAPRAFFRSDLRLAFRRGLEESLVRAGFGFDF